jgi:hypothetical protein
MPTKNTQHLPKQAKLGAKSPVSDHRPKPPATPLRRPPSPDSIQKAKDVFEQFSLSKFAKNSLPDNYIHVEKKAASLHSADHVQHVQEFQRKRVEQHLHKLAKTAEHDARKGGPAALAGITVALPKKNAKAFLRSYDHDKRTVNLGELIGLIERHAAGTAFYAKGHPTLNRLALRAKAQKFMANLRIGEKGEKGIVKK